MSAQRKGGWIQTATGRKFWPMDPHYGDVYVEDIAHALANQCRYAGHCREFYSVAQHSVLVSRAVPAEARLWGLLHDAAEAYLVDVPKPVKPHLVGYEEAERAILYHVALRFNLSPFVPDEVKRADAAILADEAAQIMVPPPDDWRLPEPPLGIAIEPWSPATARRVFLEEFARLGKGGAL
ncbi:hypothetical protein [Roseovarius sp. C03]|uniref:hypothetical protein n=1 Tax=Roseovarius sp. C03 TaxID=3449222 RepID=UPI003EDBB909